jgi:hypothetical protein
LALQHNLGLGGAAVVTIHEHAWVAIQHMKCAGSAM